MIVEIPNDYIDSWMKTQQQAFATLRDQALQMQSYFQNSNTTTDNPFTNWAKASFQAFPMSADANLTKDIFINHFLPCLLCFSAIFCGKALL